MASPPSRRSLATPPLLHQSSHLIGINQVWPKGTSYITKCWLVWVSYPFHCVLRISKYENLDFTFYFCREQSCGNCSDIRHTKLFIYVFLCKSHANYICLECIYSLFVFSRFLMHQLNFPAFSLDMKCNSISDKIIFHSQCISPSLYFQSFLMSGLFNDRIVPQNHSGTM